MKNLLWILCRKSRIRGWIRRQTEIKSSRGMQCRRKRVVCSWQREGRGRTKDNVLLVSRSRWSRFVVRLNIKWVQILDCVNKVSWSFVGRWWLPAIRHHSWWHVRYQNGLVITRFWELNPNPKIVNFDRGTRWKNTWYLIVFCKLLYFILYFPSDFHWINLFHIIITL